MRGALLFASVSLASNALGQEIIGGSTFGNQELTSNICNKTTAAANVTGIYSYNPNVLQFDHSGQPDNNGQTLPVEWLATVSENSGTGNASLQYGLWFSPGGANYSYDAGLGYDVCAYIMLLENTNWFERALEDNGDCTTAFDQSCVSDIEQAAQQYAMDIVWDPSTQSAKSNLTAGSVHAVCSDIAQALQDNFPSSCNKFMNSSSPVQFDGGALTSNNASALYKQCTVADAADNDTYYHLATYSRYTADNPTVVSHLYDDYSYITLATLLVFIPVAKANSYATIRQSVSKLQCVRPTEIAKGSMVLPAGPTPTPYSSGGLSGGEIAGIVVGVIVAVALILAGVFLWYRRRKGQAKKLETFDTGVNGAPPAYTADAKAQMEQLDTSQEHKTAVEAPNTAVPELSPEAVVAEPGTSERPIELEGEEDAVVEKEAPQAPVELPANVPRVSE